FIVTEFAEAFNETGTLCQRSDEAEICKSSALKDLVADGKIKGMRIGHHEMKCSFGRCLRDCRWVFRHKSCQFCSFYFSSRKTPLARIDPRNLEWQAGQNANECTADMTGAVKEKRCFGSIHRFDEPCRAALRCREKNWV